MKKKKEKEIMDRSKMKKMPEIIRKKIARSHIRACFPQFFVYIGILQTNYYACDIRRSTG